MNGIEIPKTLLAVWVTWVLFYFACLVALVVVAIHFIGKHW